MIYEHLPKWRNYIQKFIERNLKHVKGNILEVGIGDSSCYLVNKIGRDKFKILDPRTPENWKVDYNIPLEEACDNIDEKFDFIFCCEVLEHLKNPYRAAEQLELITNIGGVILVTVPCNLGYHGNPTYYDDYWRFFVNTVQLLFARCEVLESDKCETDNPYFPAGFCHLFRRVK